MRPVILIAALLAGFCCLCVSSAQAVVCVRGAYRAGCVGPNGAVGVRRGVYYGGARVVRRGGVVVHRGAVYRGGVYRRRW